MAVHVLRCERCDEPFLARRSDARTCSGRCRKALCLKSRKRPASDLERYADAVWNARKAGEIDAEEALLLLIEPSSRVLEGVAA